MDHLRADHFLSQPRPDILIGPPAGGVDTTTLAAHDFDVDTRTGFMPPQAPTRRLPGSWEQWEGILDEAISQKLQLGDTPDLSECERNQSQIWRCRVQDLPILSIDGLKTSEIRLRRAHLVLAWIMHFYIHSLEPSHPIRIPAPISLPLLQVSAQLQLPPILTYSDDVLYNWHLDASDPDELPIPSTLRCTTTFTSTPDEVEFYLVSSRLELVGVEALDLMRSMMDELFVGDDIAVRRITDYLRQLANIIRILKAKLLDVKRGCDPEVFYHKIRPWLRGEDSQNGRKWVFEGIEQDPSLVEPVELSGPSAGQSALIQALDVFLGVDHHSEGKGDSSSSLARSSLLKRMRLYMPRHHRAFLTHLAHNPHQVRDFVAVVGSKTSDPETKKRGAELVEAYNTAVLTLKEFRDAHMIIVALFIIGPARRGRLDARSNQPDYDSEYLGKGLQGAGQEPLKGTGGTDLVRFLKGVRDQTSAAMLSTV
ncbi:tryptophan 2,3-dioxygenase [Crassisporium funariophilum]|nr:tryptophan 2,3-dioxygenase [Crassisporium funariophilum]